MHTAEDNQLTIVVHEYFSQPVNLWVILAVSKLLLTFWSTVMKFVGILSRKHLIMWTNESPIHFIASFRRINVFTLPLSLPILIWPYSLHGMQTAVWSYRKCPRRFIHAIIGAVVVLQIMPVVSVSVGRVGLLAISTNISALAYLHKFRVSIHVPWRSSSSRWSVIWRALVAFIRSRKTVFPPVWQSISSVKWTVSLLKIVTCINSEYLFFALI